LEAVVRARSARVRDVQRARIVLGAAASSPPATTSPTRSTASSRSTTAPRHPSDGPTRVDPTKPHDPSRI